MLEVFLENTKSRAEGEAENNTHNTTSSEEINTLRTLSRPLQTFYNALVDLTGHFQHNRINVNMF